MSNSMLNDDLWFQYLAEVQSQVKLNSKRSQLAKEIVKCQLVTPNDERLQVFNQLFEQEERSFQKVVTLQAELTNTFHLSYFDLECILRGKNMPVYLTASFVPFRKQNEQKQYLINWFGNRVEWECVTIVTEDDQFLGSETAKYNNLRPNENLNHLKNCGTRWHLQAGMTLDMLITNIKNNAMQFAHVPVSSDLDSNN